MKSRYRIISLVLAVLAGLASFPAAAGAVESERGMMKYEEMIAAQQKPEDWTGLIVRVGGFSQRFVELGRATQDELIMRYGE